MSAVFTGNGLGLFNSSLSQLGTTLGGNAGVGQGSNRQLVNLATGNLVWQSTDEHLSFRGLTVGFNRTYNSLGQLADVGSDGWLTGFERRLALQSGTFNTAGSVMRRYTGDGSYQDFAYVSNNVYRSTDGEGAHDTLTWTGSLWSYIEGSTRMEEQYANHADAVRQGRLTLIRQRTTDGGMPVEFQVLYNAQQQISELRTVNGPTADALVFAYDGSGRLSSVSTREDGVVRHQVAYGYDGLGRLTSVLTDLTPGTTSDNTWNSASAASNDGRLFRTDYTYEGESLRLASVRQSDGTAVAFTYHADGRVKTVARGGEVTTYSYLNASSTRVTDSLGRAWTYTYDAARQLVSASAPAISGQSDVTSYQYDASGNVLQVKTVRGGTTLSQVDYQYDANGNVLWQWDGEGNAVKNTWTSLNLLSSQTRYVGVDPDREGAAEPSGEKMVTRYMYDDRSRLRFVVDAMGRVTEYTYASSGHGIGQQASVRQYTGTVYGSGTYSYALLMQWATAQQQASSVLVEFGYDAWGRLSQRTEYAAVDGQGVGVLDAGTGITRFTYDAQGLLRQQITVHGTGRTLEGAAPAGSTQVDYSYDGMGRLLGVMTRVVGGASDDASTLETRYAYLDSGHQVAMTTDAGMTRVETRDAAGRLVSVSESGQAGGGVQVRGSVNYYDAAGQLRASEDGHGARTYYFYDVKGRLEATVDGTGAVVRNTYDGADRVVSTRQYANRVTTTAWLVDGAVVPATVSAIGLSSSSTLDRVTSTTYDAAGRVATRTNGLADNAIRQVVAYSYDGAGRLLQTRTSDAAGTEETARVVRYFYDAQGRQIGVLDAEGYLTEQQYDRAGNLAAESRYALATPVAQRAAGTLSQVRPSKSAANDQITRYYYDGRGQRVGMVDAQGYLSEWVFDEAGNVRAERRYLTALMLSGAEATIGAETQSMEGLRARAGAMLETRSSYTGLGQLATQVDAQGTVTRYTYDEAGRLVRTELAQGTSELREGYRRYNVFGELIGEIAGEAATRVQAGMSESQLDAVYAQYGVRHGYDVLGRRIESIDAAGNRTWYFHDAQGRQTFVVRGVVDENQLRNGLGEVSETRYNAFGQVSETVAYTGRLVLATPDRAGAQAAIGVLSFASGVDSRQLFTYTAQGLLSRTTDATNGVTAHTYDAFGQRVRTITGYGSAAISTAEYVYDKRGLLLQATEAVGTAVERQSQQVRDAFGRVVTSIDGNGGSVQRTYDRLGRELTVQRTVSGRTEKSTTSYDALGRTLTVSDTQGNVTRYVHDDSARTLTVTTPEGVVVTTSLNRHGQTVLVQDAAGRTETTYNRDGQVTSTRRRTEVGGTISFDERREYDAATGLLSATVDGVGRRVELRYDAAGRVLQRIVDPAKLAAVTTYAYDGQGRQLQVTDPAGRVTGYSYDPEGRLREVAQDPAGLNLRTTYTYDAVGREVTVAVGGRTTRYTYDALGRRSTEVVDPGTGGLALTTRYTYDGNDNVTSRTDASGRTERYYYDSADRLTITVDAAGGIVRNWYDTVGRLVGTRSYLKPIDAAAATSQMSIDELWALVTAAGNSSANSTYRGEYRTYDGDGRLRYQVDTTGTVTETSYDAAGRVSATRRYASTLSMTADLVEKLRSGTTTGDGLGALVAELREQPGEQRTYYVRDASGNVIMRLDAAGSVTETRYDLSGLLVATVGYANRATLNPTLIGQLLNGTTNAAHISSLTPADASRDQAEYRVHDGAGTLRYVIDGANGVRSTLVDASGLVVGTRNHTRPGVVTDAMKDRLRAGTATVYAVETSIITTEMGNDWRKQEQLLIRDAAGRVRFTMDVLRDIYGTPTGVLTEMIYAVDRVVTVNKRDTVIVSSYMNEHIGAMRAGTMDVATVQGWLGTAPRTTHTVHDGAGRARFTLQVNADETFTVSETRYDGLGRVTARVSYGKTIPGTTARNQSAILAALTQAGADSADAQRVSTLAYGANGQLRFQVDDAGAVLEYRYDGMGRQTQTRQYALPIAAAALASESAIAAAVASQSGANVRVTTTAYNLQGQVASVTDSAGNKESYAYNALGQRTSLTNKLGYVWTYAYDAAGRLVQEDSPVVTVQALGLDNNLNTASRSIRTLIGYDALGQVIRRTEDASGVTPRITRYEYDAQGNQVRTIFPDAYELKDGQLTATGQSPTTEVVYDALGQAVVQKDVRGNYSYRMHNAVGQLQAEIDTEGYITTYSYNAHGEQVQTRRYATKVDFSVLVDFTPGTPVRFTQVRDNFRPPSADDRVLTTVYNRVGQKTEVRQQSISYVKADGTSTNATPTTRFVYNGYGELARSSVLLDNSTGLWAHTNLYYDDVGRVTLRVDAEGYVTQTRYNAMGEVVEQKEYARALPATLLAGLEVDAPPPPPSPGDAAIGYDRATQYTWDAMGRKLSETTLRNYGRSDGSQGVRSVSTKWTHDAAGQVATTSVDGRVSKTGYDALGHVVSVEDAPQKVLISNAEALLAGQASVDLNSGALYVSVSPYTSMSYNSFGQLVRVTRHGNGLEAGKTAPVASANDQVTLTSYDRQGRAVMTRDALGNRSYMQYDAADNVIHAWRTLTGNDGQTAVHSYFTYDTTGRQTSLRTERQLTATSVAVDQREVVRYNAFGEIVAKGNDDTPGATLQAEYQYDKVGNLIRSNAEGGVWRDYGYNLGGYQVREVHTVYMGPDSSTRATTRTLTDRLGRTVTMVLPSTTTNPADISYMTQTLDRWGNVIEQIDPNGFRSNYQYNDRNQLVKETRPLVKVVVSDAEGAWLRPEQNWYYDELGRLVAMRDANGNMTRYEYDGTRQVKVIDANGDAILTAYDILGRAQLSQNGLGYITFKQYDKLDRVVAHGDLLPGGNGTTRTRKTLESYTLNENGNRLTSTNAAGKTSRYDYDSRSLMLRSQTAAGVVMEYAYDLGGQRSLERYALSHAEYNVDGKLVRTNEQTWDYDYFGRLVDHYDLGVRHYSYTYDADSGQRTKETNNWGLNRETLYTANGQVREIRQGTSIYRYAYDRAGNRVLEEAETKDSIGKQFKVSTQITYDSHNRLQRIVQDDVITTKRVFELTYDYDAAGNRTHVVARTGYGANTIEISKVDNPPVVIGLPPARVVRTGVSSEFRIPLSDIFRDPEGKPLSVTASRVSGSSTAGLPSWLSYRVDATTREAVFTAGTGSSAADGQAFSIRLTAKDAANNTVYTAFSLTVRENTAPTAVAGATVTYPVKTGRPWSLDLPVNDYFADPDVGDSLALTVSVSPAAGWLTIDNSNPGVTRLSAANPVAGTYTLTLRVTDQLGLVATRKVTLTVAANTAPTVVAAIPSQTATQNRTFSLDRDIATVFRDTQGDAVRVSATLSNGAALPSWLTFNFLGDQATPQLRFHGLVPGTIANGTTYAIRLTATDPDGASVTTTFNLKVVANSAPTAPTIPDRTATVGAAWNYVVPAFSDADGDALSYAASGLPSWMRFDPETRTLSGTKATAGSWIITITAKDIEGASVSRAFTVSSSNSAPVVANPIGTISVSRNQAWSFVVPANTFSDADGDALTYSVGTLPPGISFNAATRQFAGTPTVHGNYSITLIATDGNGGTRSAMFTLAVVNDAPSYNGGLVTRNAQRGQAVNWTLPTNAFSDANGDKISYTLMVERPEYWQNFLINPMEPDIRLVPAEWLPASGSGLSIDVNTGAITGTPAPMWLKSENPSIQGKYVYGYRVKVVATDAANGIGEGVFKLNINEAPVGYLNDWSTKNGLPFSHQIAAFTDSNNDALTYSASSLPSGVSFNAATRTFSGSVSSPGTYTIQVTANDGKGGVTTVPFKLIILANSAPTAAAIGNQAGTVATAFSFTIPPFSDPDFGDTLSYGVSGLPSGLSFDPGTRTISGTPTAAGATTISVTANDGRGGSVSTSFVLTIAAAAPPNRAPYVNRQPQSPAYTFSSTNRYIVPEQGFRLAADTFIDPDNNPLTYEVLEKPSWLRYSFDAGSGHSFRGVNNNTSRYFEHPITIRATDSSGLSVVMSFYVASTYDHYDPWNPTEPLRVGSPQLFIASEEAAVEDAVSVQESVAESPAVFGAAAVAAAAAPTARVSESWYAYDSLNRVTIVNGEWKNGQIVLGANYTSYGLGYDAAGNQISQYQLRPTGSGSWTGTIRQQTFSLRGELLLTFNEIRTDGSGVRSGVVERRSYDDAGRVVERLRYFTPNSIYRYVDRERTLMSVDVSGWLAEAEQTTYDDDGRLLTQVQRTRSDKETTRSPYGSNINVTFPDWLEDTWDGDAKQRSDLSVLTESTTVSYQGAGLGYDAAGRTIGYQYAAKNYVHTYTYAYSGWDSYRELSITGRSSNSNYRTTTTILTYDGAGQQIEIREKTVGQVMDDRLRTFAYDGGGQILSRRDGTIVSSTGAFNQGPAAEVPYKNHHHVYANGQQVATLDEGGRLDVLSRLTAFSNTEAGRTQVTVMTGDSLQGIAQRVYGNSNLWYVIAEANALTGDSDLVAGATLTVPEVTTNSNDANTFKPYNPGEISGPTTPSLPYIPPPPSGGGCGTLGMIIMVVVIIVVTIYTAGAATGALTATNSAFATGATAAVGSTAATAGTLTVAGGAVVGAAAGAAGAAAGMVAGSVMGVASFSWRGVASAAITGAVGGAFGAYAKAAELGTTARVLGGAASTAAGTYAGQALSGQKASFSWRSVAISAVTNAVTPYIAESAIGALDVTSEFGADFVYGLTGGMVSAGLRSVSGDTLHEQDYLTVAADAFGNALGRKAVRDMLGSPDAKTGSGGARDAALAPDQRALSDSLDLGPGSILTVVEAGSASYGSSTSLDTMGAGRVDAHDLDRINVYPDHARTLRGWDEWVWRQDYNAWVGSGSEARIPVGASSADARAIYYSTANDWHKKNNPEAYARAMNPPAPRPANVYVLSGGEKTFLRFTGAVYGLGRSAYETAGGLLGLGRDVVLSLPGTYVNTLLTGNGDMSAAATDRLIARGEAAWAFATDGNMISKVANHFGDRFAQAAALDAKGDGYSIFMAAAGNASATADLVSLGTGVGGAAKSATLLTVRGARALAGVASDARAVARIDNATLGSMDFGPVEVRDFSLRAGAIEQSGRVLDAVDPYWARHPEFIGPRIGNSGFVTADEFAKEGLKRYQVYVEDAYANALQAESVGALTGKKSTRIGTYVDRESAWRFKQWLSYEGITEGPGHLVRMNRWLPDPGGSGRYVRPDIHIPASGVIYDATVGWKSRSSRQIVGFMNYSGGDVVTIVRPPQVGGSYSFVP